MNKKLPIGISLMVLSSICTCIGQLMWKLAAISPTIWYYLIGFVLYGMGAVLVIIAFRFGELSVLHPMLSVGFVLSLGIGALILKETITGTKLIGIGLIIVGMCFLGYSGRKEKNQ